MLVKDVFNNKIDVKINKFTYIETSNGTSEEATVELCDRLVCEKVFDKGITILFSRKVQVDAWFSLEIEIQLNRYFKVENSQTEDELKNWINKMGVDEKTSLGANIYALSSMLISQITNISLNNPLILPARFLEREQSIE